MTENQTLSSDICVSLSIVIRSLQILEKPEDAQAFVEILSNYGKKPCFVFFDSEMDEGDIQYNCLRHIENIRAELPVPDISL